MPFSQTSVFLPVLHVESRYGNNFNPVIREPQIRTISQGICCLSCIGLDTIVSRKDPSSCHVFISNLGNDYWYVPESTMLMFGSLMLSIARGICELWCVLWDARFSSRAGGLVIT